MPMILLNCIEFSNQERLYKKEVNERGILFTGTLNGENNLIFLYIKEHKTEMWAPHRNSQGCSSPREIFPNIWSSVRLVCPFSILHDPVSFTHKKVQVLQSPKFFL